MSNRTPHNSTQSYTTLLVVAIAVSKLYIIMAYFMRIEYSLLFSLFYICSFVVQVIILMKLVERIICYFDKKNEDSGVLLLPAITSLSDFFSTMFLLGISYLLKLLSDL